MGSWPYGTFSIVPQNTRFVLNEANPFNSYSCFSHLPLNSLKLFPSPNRTLLISLFSACCSLPVGLDQSCDESLWHGLGTVLYGDFSPNKLAHYYWSHPYSSSWEIGKTWPDSLPECDMNGLQPSSWNCLLKPHEHGFSRYDSLFFHIPIPTRMAQQAILQSSRDFLAYCPKLFLNPPRNQFQSPKNHIVGFTVATTLLLEPIFLY